MNQAKDVLFQNMSRYQIATKPGHRASKHLFVVKSVLAILKTKKAAALFSAWDLQKYLDSEALEDVMGSCTAVTSGVSSTGSSSA